MVNKIYAITGRGNDKSNLRRRLIEAIIRADVDILHDPIKRIAYVTSRNKAEPLTDEEKKLIINFFITGGRYTVVFEGESDNAN